MSNICSTFALEIGKGHVNPLLRVKQNEQRRGATREEYPGEKHIPPAGGEKERSLTDFGLLSFSLLLTA